MDRMGKDIIKAINEAYKLKIPTDEETAQEMGDLVDVVIKEHNYGLCDNCDRRIQAC